MTTDSRNTDEIERDLEHKRARLGYTLDQLNERLSVGHITGEAAEQLKGLGADRFRDATDRLINNARSNPAAATLAGAGLLWLMLSSPGAASNPKMPPLRPKGDPGSEMGSFDPDVMATRQASLTERVKDAASDTLSSVQDGAADLRARIVEGTEELTAEGRERVIAAREAAVEAMDATVQGANAKARDAAKSIEENPWVYGGIALAIGAAIGGALLYRKSDEEARKARNDLFAEADRIWREEAKRAAIDRNTSLYGKVTQTAAVR